MNTSSLTEWEAVDKCLGFSGAMLSGSKRTPHGCEDHTIYWNACLFNEHGQQIWHGDLDVTARTTDLQALADLIGTIYVTPEQPWRWDGFKETRKAARHRERIVQFDPKRSA